MRCRCLVFTVLFASPVAAQITVPGTYADPQTAVDSVAPGSTIVILGGTWPSLAIDKAVTLIGDPAPTFEADGVASPGVLLAGPGSGEVVLVNIETAGIVGFFSGALAGQGIAGGGFDELRVLDSRIEAAEFTLLTGIGYGGSGIETTVPFVWIESSYVQGSKTDGDGSLITGAPDAAPGVNATGEVVVLDSTINGGPNGVYPWGNSPELCPVGCPPGAGSAAVVCDTLYWANSFFGAGEGAFWVSFNGISCCQVAAPSPLNVANEIPLRSGLFSTGSSALGQTFTLHWFTPGGGNAWLVASETVEAPTTFNFGPWFLGPFGGVESRVVAPIGTSSNVVPNDVNVIGTELGFQVYEPSSGLTRPVVAVAVP